MSTTEEGISDTTESSDISCGNKGKVTFKKIDTDANYSYLKIIGQWHTVKLPIPLLTASSAV